MQTLLSMMTGVVKIPDPIYERVSEQAEQADVSRGTIIREWSQKADAYDSEVFNSEKPTHDMDDLRLIVEDLYRQGSYAEEADDIPDEFAQMQKQLADELLQFIES
ncbi:hypothetical protein OSG_eHP9_00150 [environmental Halophage eHP-9]|nr:hypothetical protein OSG_eHP9_00150 [environmental Halophage eHP-9]